MLSQGNESASAVLYKDSVLTYGDLRRKVGGLASGLLAQGRRKGDRIGICSENSLSFVVAYLGIIQAGLVAVPFQTELTEEGFGSIVTGAGIRHVFVSKRFYGRLRAWADQRGVTLIDESGLDYLTAASPQPFPEINPKEDLAALMFTSGSTGQPKGVMVSHRNLECNTRDIISYMDLTPSDRVMVVLPFHYCFGLSLLHTHLLAEASLVLNNDFKLYPETVLRQMQSLECTGLAGVPSTYQLLLRKSRFRQMRFPRLRWLQQAGGKLPSPYIEELRRSFPRVLYFLMYGQTEATARLSYLPPDRLADKLGSIGKGLPSTTLEVLKADGTAVTPGSDQVGEIVAHGDNIARGYWNDPEETSKYFRNGKLYTGDLARVDSDGFIYIVERERDMIKSGGNRVSAKEIEDVVAEIPEVVEVAVIGMPHEFLGEAIMAFVVPTQNAAVTPDCVAAHCRARLPAFKRPEEIIFLKTMPHNGAGKILKRELKNRASSVFQIVNHQRLSKYTP